MEYMRTDWLIERVSEVVILLFIQLEKNFAAVSQLLRMPILFAPLHLPVFGSVCIRKVLRRRGMDFALRASDWFWF
jgi:hypothetical protein